MSFLENNYLSYESLYKQEACLHPLKIVVVVVARLEVVEVAATTPLDSVPVHNNDQKSSHPLACVSHSVDHNILNHIHKDHNHCADDYDHYHASWTPSTYLLFVISDDLGHGSIGMKVFDTFPEGNLGKQWHDRHRYCQEYGEHNDILLHASHISLEQNLCIPPMLALSSLSPLWNLQVEASHENHVDHRRV